ncbi:hypothetical protein ACJZ2D_016251 [Fusarium nematophilum]
MARTTISSRQRSRKSTVTLRKNRRRRLMKLRSRQSQRQQVAPSKTHINKDRNTEDYDANQIDSQETTRLQTYVDSSKEADEVESLVNAFQGLNISDKTI